MSELALIELCVSSWKRLHEGWVRRNRSSPAGARWPKGPPAAPDLVRPPRPGGPGYWLLPAAGQIPLTGELHVVEANATGVTSSRPTAPITAARARCRRTTMRAIAAAPPATSTGTNQLI